MAKIGEIPLGTRSDNVDIPIYDLASLDSTWMRAKDRDGEVGAFFMEPAGQAFYSQFRANHPETGEPYAPSELNATPEPGTKIIEDWEDGGAFPPGWTTNTMSNYQVGVGARYNNDYGAVVGNGEMASDPNDGLDWYCAHGEADRLYFRPSSGNAGDTFEAIFLYENGNNYYSTHADFGSDTVTVYRADAGTREAVITATGELSEDRWYRTETYTKDGRIRLLWADVQDTYESGADPYYYADGTDTGHIYTEGSAAVRTDRRLPYMFRVSGIWWTDAHEAFDVRTDVPAPYP